MPSYYPVFLNLQDRRCVVIGGGDIAERKVLALRECGARLTLISPAVTPTLQRLAVELSLELRRRAYQAGDLAGAWLAIAATDDTVVNQAVQREAEERGIFVNVVDVSPLCSFIAPSIVRRGEITLAISTGGVGPALARHIREKLERVVGPEYASLAHVVADARKALRARGRRASPERWRECLNDSLLELVRQKRLDEARDHLLQDLLREGERRRLVTSARPGPIGDTP
ncbi:MAG: bifunctional precorrin-2 dehydrogenase/sirohydrochlorin ferrochelatase [Dehalococcoidia bacterium]|nr:bifunctional precorrin-2 dehydrogenase/sirohydrochlorin ferrochelatase [Dehalococcoidia bacterium]